MKNRTKKRLRRYVAALSAMVLSVVTVNPGIAYASTKEDNSAIEQANPNAAYVYSTNIEDTNEYILENINKNLAGADKLEPADITVLKQTMAVKDKLPEGGYNLKTMFQSEDSKYADAFVGTNQSYVYLYNTDDNSDYYVAYVNTMNNDSRTVVSDYSFTYNNLYGEVVDDCIYDADTGLAYIPKKYTKENKNGYGIGNIQVQLMQLVNSYNPTVSVNVVVDAKGVSGSVAKSGKANANAMLKTTEIFLAEDSKSRADIKSEWLSVYINDTPISSYEYNEATGILKVDSAPTAIDTLKVVVDKPSIIETVFDNTIGLVVNPITVYAAMGGDYSADGSDWNEASDPWTFSSVPSVGDSVEITGIRVEYQYDDGHVEENSNSYVSADSECWAVHNDDLLNMIYAVVNGNEINPAGYFLSTSYLQFSASIPEEKTYEINGVTWHIPTGLYWLSCTHNAEGIYTENRGEDIQEKVIVRIIDVVRESETSGYIILGMVTPTVLTQTGAGFFKVPYRLDLPKTGSVGVHKYSANSSITDGNRCYSLEGAKFGVYSDENCTNEVAELETNSEGNASVDGLALGTYWVREKEPSKGYLLNTNKFTATITAETLSYTVDVQEEPGDDPVSLILSKVDSSSMANSSSGNASLGNAEYTVKYYDVDMSTDPAQSGETAKYTWVFRTDSNGKVYLSEEYRVGGDNLITEDGTYIFPLGTLTFQESKAPDGYLINAQVYVANTFREAIYVEGNAQPVGYQIRTKNLPTGENAALEDVVRGYIEINKTREIADGSKVKEEGAEFEVYLKSAGSYSSANAEEKDYLVTDSNGYAKTKGLPYGTYTVHQTKSHEGNNKVADFDVVVSKNGDVYSYNLDNPIVKSKVKVFKKDAITGNLIAYEGAGFKIINPDGSTYSESGIDIFYTDNSGVVTVPGELPYGKGYQLIEVQAPVPYVLDATPVLFDIDEDTMEQENGAYVVKVVKNDKPVVGSITIEKTGEVLVSFDGPKEADNKNHFIYKVRKLKDAEFVVYADEDIYSPDYAVDSNGNRVIIYAKDSVVANVVTNEEGLAKVENLPLGKYRVIEKKAPTTLILNEKPMYAELAYEDQNQAFVSKSVSLFNERQKVVIEAIKKDSDTKKLLAGTTFGLYAAEDIVGYDGKVIIKKDQCIEKAVTDKDGKAVFNSDLPLYNFYVKELDPSIGYGTKNEVQYVDATYKGQTVKLQTYTKEFYNDHTEIIGTTAKDNFTTEHIGAARYDAILIDTVEFKNLCIGKEYKVVGILMDKATGKALLDKNGKEITAEKTFVAEEEDGSIEVAFKFDATGMQGITTVVFEDLYQDGVKISTHAEIEDEGQTIYFPEVKTTIKSTATNNHTGLASIKETLIDTVSYKNLVIGKEYSVEGHLVVKSTGEPLLDKDGNMITAGKKFTAEKTSGTIDIVFEFDASLLKGETIVAFETLKYYSIEIATHADIEDEDQSIYYPTISTSASVGGSKLAQRAADLKVVDTITYKNLIIGHSYTIKGILMDKSTGKALLDANGNYVTVEKTFEAKKVDDSIDVEFVFDATGTGFTGIVVFEQLYENDILLTTHEDITDVNQTILFEVPKTGDSNPIGLWISMMIVSLLGMMGLGFLSLRRKATLK